MKILVVGASGYIGSYLIPHLLAAGHKVTAYDRGLFGKGHLPDNGNLKFIVGDIRWVKQMNEACEGQDVVILLAAIAAESMIQKDPTFAKTVNIGGAMNVAISAKQAGVKRLIYASSVAVYGSTTHPAIESDEQKPSSNYGEHKKEAEYRVRKNFPEAVITRVATVCGYSSNMAFHMTINRMVNEAIRTGIVTVNGGTQRRSHINMKDVVKAYLLLLDHPKAEGEAFNFVHSNLSIRDTAELVARVLGHTVSIQTTPPTDGRSYTVSGAKALEVLGFAPTHSIEDAIGHMKAVFASNQWKDSLTSDVYQRICERVDP